MEDWSGLGRGLILLGVVLALAGVAVSLLGKGEGAGLGQWFGWFGKLPGDILIKRERVTVYVPLATSIVVSVVLSLLVYFFVKR